MSDVLASAGTEIRENLVTTAVKFLQNPNVQRCTMESKQRFLRNKGLTDPEIQKAIEKCAEMIDLPSLTSELMFFQSRRNWFRDHVVPVLIYGGFAYGCYWFYKNIIRQLLFVEEPKRKSTAECIDDLRKSLDVLNTNVTSLRSEMAASAQHNALRSQLDNIKSDIASVKGILLNRETIKKTENQPQPVSATTSNGGEIWKPNDRTVQENEAKPKEHFKKESELNNANFKFRGVAIRNKIFMTDSDKPKRPMSAYMLWLNSAREQLKAENPGLKVTEIAKKGGQIWRSMDQSVWHEKAAKAKEQYLKEMEIYEKNTKANDYCKNEDEDSDYYY